MVWSWARWALAWQIRLVRHSHHVLHCHRCFLLSRSSASSVIEVMPPYGTHPRLLAPSPTAPKLTATPTRRPHLHPRSGRVLNPPPASLHAPTPSSVPSLPDPTPPPRPPPPPTPVERVPRVRPLPRCAARAVARARSDTGWPCSAVVFPRPAAPVPARRRSRAAGRSALLAHASCTSPTLPFSPLHYVKCPGICSAVEVAGGPCACAALWLSSAYSHVCMCSAYSHAK